MQPKGSSQTAVSNLSLILVFAVSIQAHSQIEVLALFQLQGEAFGWVDSPDFAVGWHLTADIDHRMVALLPYI